MQGFEVTEEEANTVGAGNDKMQLIDAVKAD